MFRQYREIQPHEFFIVGGDCSQGGSDFNVSQFYSVTRQDVPLVYHKRGVAADMTTDIFPVVETIADITGVKPVVGFERNMGGASEMKRLQVLNREGKYILFRMPVIGSEKRDEKGHMDRTDKLGFDTSALSRPIIVGGLKQVVDINGIGIYDQDTVDELSIFIENPYGRPEAAKGGHDDLVMSLAGAKWMSLFETPVQIIHRVTKTYDKKKWQL